MGVIKVYSGMDSMSPNECGLKEGARLGRVTVTTVRKWIDSGRLKARMVDGPGGAYLVVDKGELKSFADKHRSGIYRSSRLADPVAAKQAIYSTGQLARIFNVAPRTVSKWIDSGRLVGYRIPGSEDRRATHAELVNFIANSNMPMRIVPGYIDRTLLVTQDDSMANAIVENIHPEITVEVAGNWGAAGMEFASGMVAAVVVDFSMGAADARTFLREIRKRNRGVQLFGVYAEGEVPPEIMDVPDLTAASYPFSPTGLDNFVNAIEVCVLE